VWCFFVCWPALHRTETGRFLPCGVPVTRDKTSGARTIRRAGREFPLANTGRKPWERDERDREASGRSYDSLGSFFRRHILTNNCRKGLFSRLPTQKNQLQVSCLVNLPATKANALLGNWPRLSQVSKSLLPPPNTKQPTDGFQSVTPLMHQ